MYKIRIIWGKFQRILLQTAAVRKTGSVEL